MNALVVALALVLGQAAPEAPAPEAHAAAGAAEEQESLGDAITEHVSDGYVLEVPGWCPNEEGGFHLDCEIDLKGIFGESMVFHRADGSVLLDMTPTKHVVMMWIAALLGVLLVVFGARKRAVVPKGGYNLLELLVQFVRNEIVVPNIGERDASRFTPYVCTIFFFILFMNLLGIVPWAGTATGNLAVTATLALFTFLVTQYAAIRAMGLLGFLKHLTGGVHWALWLIMIPVEILGLFTKPFSLTIRLFANMTAGHMVILSLLGLIWALGTPWVAAGSVPLALLIFALELFVAFIQAYIFAMLSALFIGAGLQHHGHEEHDVHGHTPGHETGHGTSTAQH